MRSPVFPRMREGLVALEEEIGVWNSQAGEDKRLFLFLISTFLSLSHIKHFFFFFFKLGTNDHTASPARC